MKKTLPAVSVVIVNYNGKRWLTDCLRSLRQLDYPQDRMQIIMVDNGSTDDSIEHAGKILPEIHILRNDRNNYCRANNLGIKAAKGKYIAFLNNDTRVDKNWLKELVTIIDSDEKIGGVGSKVLFMDGKLNSTGHMELPDFYWTDRGFAEEEKGQYDLLEEVGSVTNAASLYRKACLTDAGSFDEDFNMYLEDVDLGIRIRQKGWKIVYCPKSVVYHQVHGTATLGEVHLGVEKNRLLLLAKHFPEKLGDALLGRGYFSMAQGRSEGPGLIDIMPEIILKLRKNHGASMTEKVLPSLLVSLKKETNLKVHTLIQSLNYEKSRVEEKDKELKERSRELELRAEELGRAALLEKELRAGQTALENMLKSREEECQRLRGEIDEKSLELKKQSQDLEIQSGRFAQHEILEKNLRAKLEEKSQELQKQLREVEAQSDRLAQYKLSEKDLRAKLEEKNQELQKQIRQLETQSERLAQYEVLERNLLALRASQEDVDKIQREEMERIKVQHGNAEKEFCAQQAIWEEEAESLKADLAQIAKNRDVLKKQIQELEIRSEQAAQREASEKKLREELEAKSGEFQKQILELCARLEKENKELKKQSDDFYASRSFKCFIGPAWRALNYLKRLKLALFSSGKKSFEAENAKAQVLFIKPQRVSVGETKRKINDFKKKNPLIKICALANLMQEDYDRMSSDRELLVDEKLFFSPGIKKFDLPEQIKVLSELRSKKLREAIVLVGVWPYWGYKLAVILAFLTGAKKVKIQRVRGQAGAKDANTPKRSSGIKALVDVLSFPFRVLMTGIVVLWFLVFIVGGIQWRKFFYRYRKTGH
ncbi:MAG: glycosyltransferase [Candidatus Omnitrophica bacterium]|nr:glycosyltransferase [Candidatus Omnitrophota bacterium]